MDSKQLYQSQQAAWQTLSNLLDRAEKDIHKLSTKEIEQLGQLYRTASSDLALAQRDFPQHQITAYLNQLVAHGHAVIYRSEPLVGNRFAHFFKEDFPKVFRQMLPFTLAAALLFWVPVIIAMAAILIQPDTAHWLLPDGGEGIRSTLEGGKLWTDIPVAERPYTSSFIMQNNIQVSFMAFAGGLTAGLYTIWVLITNGLMLGAAIGLTFHYRLGFDLLTFIIGHGVIELSVIMMAGGAGLMLAWAIIHPGLLRRSDALKSAASRCVYLVIGCLPLLIIAGTIEGFISPADNIPWVIKWLTGLSTGIALYSYLFLAGRPPKEKKYRVALATAASAPSISNSD